MVKKIDDCRFCAVLEQSQQQIIKRGMCSYAVYDEFPVTLYHCLIIAERHVEDFFDLTDRELVDIFNLVKQCKADITCRDKSVVGFNVGVNIGAAAGQSIFHVHIHLIPRRVGDSENPRGGVRAVIPGRQNY